MENPLEKVIESTVCAYAKEKGFAHFKFSSPGHWGVPDRIFFGDMETVFLIEFKRKGEKPTPAQEREAKRLTDMRHRVYLVDTISEGIEVIDDEAGMVETKRAAFECFVQSMAAMTDRNEVRH